MQKQFILISEKTNPSNVCQFCLKDNLNDQTIMTIVADSFLSTTTTKTETKIEAKKKTEV